MNTYSHRIPSPQNSRKQASNRCSSQSPLPPVESHPARLQSIRRQHLHPRKPCPFKKKRLSCLINSQPYRLPRRSPRLIPPNLLQLLLRLVVAELEHRALDPAAIANIDALDDPALLVTFARCSQLANESLNRHHARRLVDRELELLSWMVPRLVFEPHQMNPGVLFREYVG